MTTLLIAVVGTSGIGKTSLVRALAADGQFAVGLESHQERPFQTRYARDPRFALPNQIDFLLTRAEQERALRLSDRPGLLDGGLDLDFHCFTRLFHRRGDLDEDEFALCRRLYEFIRSLQSGPELILRLTASEETIAQRLARRERINIARLEEATVMEGLIDEWLSNIEPGRVLVVDVSDDDPDYARLVPGLLERIQGTGIGVEF